ncbi:hypothetical protein M426DRAFT_325923 [Hypoxylon sp. CI-4A]|nr:hypothetical protein M426DRAFT_325923 [Hypoxylon sp. CI-4A]
MASSSINFNSPDFQRDPALWPAPPFVVSTSSSSPTLTMPAESPSPAHHLDSQDLFGTWQDRFNREWAMLSMDQPTPPKDDISEGQPPTSNDQGRDSLLAIIRSLSDLNVDLFSLSSAVPKPPTSTSQPLSWKDKDFAIDKTFQLSQRFIKALDRLYPQHSRRPSKDVISQPDQDLESTHGTPFDQSLFLLVLSCHQKLVETYDDIFGNMQACLDRSAITAPEDYVAMPDVKVGSFSLPNSSALQITLVLQLARHLLQRMGSIIKALDRSRMLAADDANDLMSLTFKAVNTREANLIERINKLRYTLVSLDIL